MAVDFNYFLNRKYNLLQQGANTADVTAAATTRNAATAALTGEAAAALDRVRARLLPAESAANIGLTQAQTGLTSQQASIVAPESQARIANLGAQTGLTTTQNQVLRYTGLGEEGGLAPAVRSAIRLQRQGFRLGNIVPARGTGPNDSMTAEELDRLNNIY